MVPTLRLGSLAPDFEAETTMGLIKFSDFCAGSFIGLSVDTVERHLAFHEDIALFSGDCQHPKFPIIADQDRKVARIYSMLDDFDETNKDEHGNSQTVRTVFVLDNRRVIRLMLSYPASTGRHFTEILRVIDSLQIGDKYKVSTPVNWKKGDPLIIHPSVSDEEAKILFPGYTTTNSYLRYTTREQAAQLIT